MKNIILTIISISVFQFCLNAQNGLLTKYEKSEFTETFTYEEAVEYAKVLSHMSPIIHYTTFGKSGQGYELPLLIVDKNQNFTIEKVKESGNAIILVEANIHPGEPEGIDAGFILIRDIAISKKRIALLDNVTLLFIPSFNVDGHRRFMKYNRINQNGPKEAGWRTNARNLNLNRDFLKTDAVEMKHWLKLFNDWLPDFFIDCHTTDGADYQYALTYALEIYGNMDEGLTKWQKEDYLKPVTTMMKDDGYDIFPYVAFKRWHDPRSGLRSWVGSPVLSEGYTAIQNRPGLLIETHMLKDYKTRVDVTYQMIKNTMQLINNQYKKLIDLNKNADKKTASKEFRNKIFNLDYKFSEKDSTIVDFKGIDYTTEKSEITGGVWFKYGDKKNTFKIPFYNTQKAVKSAKLPEAYIIGPEWKETIERLNYHGIKYKKLKKPASINVKSYKFSDVKWAKEPYEGRMRINNFKMEKIEEERFYPEGSVVIFMDQRTARVIAHIFEPEAPSSYLKWGFFNNIFEQKEYGEVYVMEEMAIKMLKKDKKLKKEFEKMLEENPQIKNKQWAICNWFYSKTKYWDNRKDVYPVGKIFEAEFLKALEF